ncbi:MAG TPA: acetolactate synthase small subunit [Firmicutes bacterium]|nr:acetolactate synthase small subunit [Bacillota bacterium]
MKHILAVLVENKPGVLARVAGLFSRRGFNIDSIAVGETTDPAISRMTIMVEADEKTLEQIDKQLNKLVNVLKVSNLTREGVVMRELMLIKVRTSPETRQEIQHIIDSFRAKIVDVSLNSLIIEVTGDEEKLEALQNLLEHFGILEMVRTGKIAILRGSKITKNGRMS